MSSRPSARARSYREDTDRLIGAIRSVAARGIGLVAACCMAGACNSARESQDATSSPCLAAAPALASAADAISPATRSALHGIAKQQGSSDAEARCQHLVAIAQQRLLRELGDMYVLEKTQRDGLMLWLTVRAAAQASTESLVRERFAPIRALVRVTGAPPIEPLVTLEKISRTATERGIPAFALGGSDSGLTMTTTKPAELAALLEELGQRAEVRSVAAMQPLHKRSDAPPDPAADLSAGIALENAVLPTTGGMLSYFMSRPPSLFCVDASYSPVPDLEGWNGEAWIALGRAASAGTAWIAPEESSGESCNLVLDSFTELGTLQRLLIPPLTPGSYRLVRRLQRTAAQSIYPANGRRERCPEPQPPPWPDDPHPLVVAGRFEISEDAATVAPPPLPTGMEETGQIQAVLAGPSVSLSFAIDGTPEPSAKLERWSGAAWEPIQTLELKALPPCPDQTAPSTLPAECEWNAAAAYVPGTKRRWRAQVRDLQTGTYRTVLRVDGLTTIDRWIVAARSE
jgi:hypothetical protein